MIDRRDFLRAGIAGASLKILRSSDIFADQSTKTDFLTRGVVLVPEDLTLADWPDRAKNAGPRETAQVLEYWLDVSRYSRWKRPAVKLPWNRDVFTADVETYRNPGIRHVTTFAVWVDADYKKQFDDLGFIAEYGEGMKSK